jgi:hypothetical protein
MCTDLALEGAISAKNEHLRGLGIMALGKFSGLSGAPLYA